MDKNIIKILITKDIQQRLFPGCSVGLIESGRIEFLSAGSQTYDAGSPLINEQTIYDVASITKSIPTALLILQLIKAGKINLNDQLDKYLPEVKDKPLSQITIRQLLSFAPQFPFTLSKLKDNSAEEILQTIINSTWTLPATDEHPVSNANAILLTLVLQQVTGQSIDKLAEEFFFQPLHMTRTTFHPEKLALSDIVPTEIQEWRGGLVHGQVHDESAWKLRSKLIVGSAGLFSCTADLVKFMQLLLIKHGQTEGLGWEVNKTWMGTQVSDQAFGKTGFTGCFLLIDPVQDKGLVFLSNCVYPHRPVDRQKFNLFRQKLCELIFNQTYEIT